MTDASSATCTFCGTQIVAGAAFCHVCGTSLAAAGTPPPNLSPDPDEQFGRALRGQYEVRIGDWMSRGWTVFTKASGPFLGFAAIFWLLLVFPPHVGIVLSPVMAGGFYLSALKARRNETLSFTDFWLAFNEFISLSLAGLVSFAFMFAGLCTLGLVTIYLWVAYQFAYTLIVDRRMEFWDALEASRKAVTKQWIGLFAFALCLFMLNLVAFLVTLSLGLIVTLPFTACVLVEAYADIFGVRGGVPGRTASGPPGGNEAPAPVGAS